jgi:hypothetical protein
LTLKGVLGREYGEVNEVSYIRGFQQKENIKCTAADNMREEPEVYDYLSSFLQDS